LKRSAIPKNVSPRRTPITHQAGVLFLMAAASRNDQFLAGIESRAALQAVGVGDGRRGHVIFFANGRERLPLSTRMTPPAPPICPAEYPQFPRRIFARCRREMQFECRIVGVASRSSEGSERAAFPRRRQWFSATSRRSIARPGLPRRWEPAHQSTWML